MTILATLEFSDGGLRFAIFFATLLPAIWLAAQRSTFLVDYYIVVACLNRFVRRLLDWSGGQYDDKPITSLLPLIIGVMMTVVVIGRLHTFPSRIKRSAQLLGGAVLYATVVGVTNGAAMLFDVVTYIPPLAMMYYALACEANEKNVDRWIAVTAGAAVAVGAYGWFQWVYVPPWDAQWVEWSMMWSSMGHPEAFKWSVCSTLESRGPYGWFLAAAAAPMFAAARWRKRGGLPAALFIAASILPSTVRSSWALLIAGIAGYSRFRGRGAWRQSAVVFVALVVALVVLKQQLPKSETMMSRIESIADIQSDRSFQGRLTIAASGPALILQRPQGYGFGSSGTAAKLSGVSVSGDNGYITLLTTFGLPGIAMLIAAFYYAVRLAIRLCREQRSQLAALALGQLAGGMAGLLFANWLNSTYSGLALMLFGGAFSAALINERRPARAAQPSLPMGAVPLTHAARP